LGKPTAKRNQEHRPFGFAQDKRKPVLLVAAVDCGVGVGGGWLGFGCGRGGLAWGTAEIFVDAGEAVFDDAFHVVEADGEGEFVFGGGEGFGHELGEIGEGAGGFDVVVSAGDGDVETTEGGIERAVTDEIGGQARSDLLACFDSVIYFVGVPLVKVAELRGFVFLEHAALAAVGEEERA
jgi:hypothetical protein